MRKVILVLLMFSILPLTSAAGDNWLLHFSDGTLKLNGTDVCLDDGTCMSTIIAGGTGDINGVTTDGPYLSGGALSGQVDLLLNETYLNSTITTIATGLSGGNSSWNQTLADSLYAPIGSGSDNASWNESYANTLYLLTGEEANLNVNSSEYWDNYNTANTTWFENIAGVLSLKLSELSSYLDTWLSGKSTDYLAQGSNNLYDNSSWNETYADSKYALIGGGADNSSWNQTYADTLYAPVNYGDNWNKTYADTLYSNYSDSDIDGTETAFDGWDKDASNDFSGSWNDLTDIPAGFSDGIDNQSTGGADWTEITSIPAGFDDDIDNDTTYSALSEFNNDVGFWNDTYASFNKTYADTLYADIGVTGDNSSWNESYADTLYADISVVDTNVLTDADFNATQMENNGGTLNILESWLSTFFDTLFGGKTTDDLTQGSNNLYDNSSWNQTLATSLYADISVTGDNSSFNQSLTDTLYADISITGDNSSWNETYANTLYYNSESDLTTLLDDNYAPINYGDDWNKTYADTLYEPISAHFDASTTTNITCFNTACDWYMNATDNCEYLSNGGKECAI